MRFEKPKSTIITWDWKEQPDWSLVNEAIDNASLMAKIWKIETGDDSFGIVIGQFKSETDAQDWFNNHRYDDDEP